MAGFMKWLPCTSVSLDNSKEVNCWPQQMSHTMLIQISVVVRDISQNPPKPDCCTLAVLYPITIMFLYFIFFIQVEMHICCCTIFDCIAQTLWNQNMLMNHVISHFMASNRQCTDGDTLASDDTLACHSKFAEISLNPCENFLNEF